MASTFTIVPTNPGLLSHCSQYEFARISFLSQTCPLMMETPFFSRSKISRARMTSVVKRFGTALDENFIVA